MTLAKYANRISDRNARYQRLVALMIITCFMVGCLLTPNIQSSFLSAPGLSNGKGPSDNGSPDPDAYMYGHHLYDAVNWYIPPEGADTTISIPANWNISRLGLTFYNGTLLQKEFINATTQTTSATSLASDHYEGYITNLFHNQNNLTIYQMLISISALKAAQSTLWTTVNGLSNTTYPNIDSSIGIAQFFTLSTHAQNLSVQISLARFGTTTGNLTIEVRRSTSDNHVGGLIKSASLASTSVSTGFNWVTVSIPQVNLEPGNYFIVIHTKGWLDSGGGYRAGTTLRRSADSSAPGWVTSDRGTNWQNQVNISGVSYYFKGFKLMIRATPLATPSELNLKINDSPVADNLKWNQSVWNAIPPYQFKITSDYPVTQMNFTYRAWAYVYGSDNLLRNGYYASITGYKNTTAVPPTNNFTYMYTTLEYDDLFYKPGIVNTTDWTVNLQVRLFNGSKIAIGGSLYVNAWAELLNKTVGLSFSGPYSLQLQFVYTHPTGVDNEVILAENALIIGPINSQVDNVYLESSRLNRDRWSFNLGAGLLSIYREAFTAIPQFTLTSGLTFTSVVYVFNNFTAITSTTITSWDPDITPNAKSSVTNTTALIDLEGLSQVNVTITDPNGTLVSNTPFNLVGTTYVFNWTTRGAGIYGVKVTSSDPSSYTSVRWVGAATVEDAELSPMIVTLSPGINFTSQQSVLISTNLSYVGHPEFEFDGTVQVNIYVFGTGATVQLNAIWNATAHLYQASYQTPTVTSVTLLGINVKAYDLKGRASIGSTSVYIIPGGSPPLPQVEPSIALLIELAAIAIIAIVPLAAYLIGKRKKE